MSVRKFGVRHPVLGAIVCAALQFLITVAILQAGHAFVPAAAFGKVKLVAFASTVILPLLLVHAFGLWRKVGLELGKVKPSPVFVAALLMTAAPFLVLGVHTPKGPGMAGQFTIQLVNAFGEELLFRGVIFALLLGLPKWRAILLNGVLFGAMHLIHGVMDVDWRTAAGKALVTAVAGMMFTAVRYASGSLWVVIALHMLLNLAMIYSNLPVVSDVATTAAERWANIAELALVAWVLTQSGAGVRRRSA